MFFFLHGEGDDKEWRESGPFFSGDTSGTSGASEIFPFPDDNPKYESTRSVISNTAEVLTPNVTRKRTIDSSVEKDSEKRARLLEEVSALKAGIAKAAEELNYALAAVEQTKLMKVEEELALFPTRQDLKKQLTMLQEKLEAAVHEKKYEVAGDTQTKIFQIEAQLKEMPSKKEMEDNLYKVRQTLEELVAEKKFSEAAIKKEEEQKLEADLLNCPDDDDVKA